MYYDEFVERFVDSLEQKMADDNVSVERTTVTRENEIRDAVTVRFGDEQVAPIVYLQDRYAMYNRGYDIDTIADHTAYRLRSEREKAPEVPMLSRAEAERRLYCAVVGAEANPDLLRQVPHEIFADDLAVVARYRLTDEASFLVRNDICSTLQMTPSEIMEVAHRNTEAMDFNCRSMDEVLHSLMADEFPSVGREQEPAAMPDCHMYVCSNQSGIDGAMCITSTDFLDRVHERLGEDFVILPSSRHEVIVLPDSLAPDTDALRSMVHEVNTTQVEACDRLSDEVYHYDSMTKQISIAGKDREQSIVAEPVKAQSRAH